MAKARLKTPISYYGGKQTMLKYILPLIPEHKVYTEAYCGGCAVLFGKQPVKCEIINDMNKELINFYRVAQSDYPALKREIDASLHSRDQHTHAKHIMTHPQFFTPVQRAWAIWIGSKLGFASMLDGTFGYDRSGTTTLKLFNGKDQFTEAVCQRLGHVTVESEDGKNDGTIVRRRSTSSIRPMWAPTAATTRIPSTSRIWKSCWLFSRRWKASSC